MKKLILFFILFFSFQNITFGDTFISDFCPDTGIGASKILLLEGDNRDSIENKNSKWLCNQLDYGDITYKVFSYSGSLINSYTLDRGTYALNEPFHIETINYHYTLVSSYYDNNGGNRSIVLVITSKTDNTVIFQEIGYLNTSINNIAQFVFDDVYLYFGSFNNYYKVAIDTDVIELGTSTLTYFSEMTGLQGLKYYQLIDNAYLSNSYINDSIVKHEYNQLLQQIDSTIIYTSTGNSLFNNFRINSLESFYSMHGHNTDLLATNGSQNIDTYSSYLSYININDLYFIPNSGLQLSIDYSKLFGLKAIHVGTSPNSEIYYISDNILYNNNDPALLDPFVIADSGFIDTNPIYESTGSGFLDIIYDLDGNGDISIGEALISPITFFNGLWTKIETLGLKLKEILQKFMEIGNFAFNFNIFGINSTYAEGEAVYFASQFNYDENQDNPLYDLFLVTKNFLYFLVLFVFILIILVTKGK